MLSEVTEETNKIFCVDLINMQNKTKKSIEKFSELSQYINIDESVSKITCDFSQVQVIDPSYAPVIYSFMSKAINNSNKYQIIISRGQIPKLSSLFISQSDKYKKYIREKLIGNKAETTENCAFMGSLTLSSDEKVLSAAKTIINDAPVLFDEKVKDDLCNKLIEMFLNAFEHSETQLAYHSRCYDENDDFTFSILDYGIGIPNKVRIKYPDMSDVEGLKWAFVKGNSTKESDGTHGCGLHVLESFVEANKGEIFVVSGGAYASFNFEEGVRKKYFYNLQIPFHGTLFSVKIKSDRLSTYRFKHRKENNI